MSEKNKDPEIHVHKQVVQGEVKEKSKFKKALSVFLADDIDSVKDSIMDDYIVPRVDTFKKDAIRRFKEFVVDSIEGGLEMIVLGSTAKKNKSKYGYYGNQKVQYYTIYDGKGDKQNVAVNTNTRGLKTVEIPGYGEAMKVLNELQYTISHFNHATVSDYYQLVGVPSTKIDFNYGWVDLVGVEANYVGKNDEGDDMYVLDLPRPIALND